MCSSYPVFSLLSCTVRGIKQMQNSSGDSESPWNIPHCFLCRLFLLAYFLCVGAYVFSSSSWRSWWIIQLYDWSQLTLGIWLSNCVAPCRKLSDNPCHTQILFPAFTSIAFEINSWSLHTFDPLQHPFCSFGIRFSSSIYFCIRLLIIEVINLYIVGRQVTGL